MLVFTLQKHRVNCTVLFLKSTKYKACNRLFEKRRLFINRIKNRIVMIKIKEIEITTPRWWQVGLIILVIITIENPEHVQKILENVVKKLP